MRETTILNIIAGLECPTTGNVYIDDALSNSVEPKDRDVAMVFQNHALYPHLSVYKNLAFPLKLRKYSKKDIEKEVFFIANLLNIAELLNRKPNQLSGGQEVVVVVAGLYVTQTVKKLLLIFSKKLSLFLMI